MTRTDSSKHFKRYLSFNFQTSACVYFYYGVNNLSVLAVAGSVRFWLGYSLGSGSWL